MGVLLTIGNIDGEGGDERRKGDAAEHGEHGEPGDGLLAPPSRSASNLVAEWLWLPSWFKYDALWMMAWDLAKK
jgi:hypothetical protein